MWRASKLHTDLAGLAGMQRNNSLLARSSLLTGMAKGKQGVQESLTLLVGAKMVAERVGSFRLCTKGSVLTTCSGGECSRGEGRGGVEHGFETSWSSIECWSWGPETQGHV